MKTVKLMMGAALLLAASMVPASATVVFSVNGVTTSSGGNLSGTFTTNDALSAVLFADIIAPATGGFGGFEYKVAIPGANSTVTAQTLPAQYFRLDSIASPQYELQIFFTTGLSATGGTVGTTSSSEHDPYSGNRYLSGPVTLAPANKVPEPLSLSLFGAGIIGAGLIRRRKTAKA